MTGRRYAEDTKVGPADTRAAIERVLVRYGAREFVYAWREEAALIGFVLEGRHIRITLPLPGRDEARFRYTEAKRVRRSDAAAAEAYDQAVRALWRALLLVITAKLEAVKAGIATFETEFLAYIMLPDGSTMGEYYGPQLDEVYRNGTMPPLLPGLGQAGRGAPQLPEGQP